MPELSQKHLLGIEALTPEDIQLIFDTTDSFKQVINRPIKKVPSLRDLTVANLFFENSTRTRISFELAEKRLSADVINFSASSSSVSKGETMLDTVNNILAMKVDMIVLRHPHPGAPHFLARHVPAIIINAGDGVHEHPTQALLDAYTIRERLGHLKGVRILILGDILHSRVALSNIFCLKKMGCEVALCAPPTLLPRNIRDLGVHVYYRLEDALPWAQVVNVLRIQRERQQEAYFPSLREYRSAFGLTRRRLSMLDHQPVILHPGPVNRGIEIETEVADDPQSVILDQVENGVATRMAILYLLASKAPLAETPSAQPESTS